MPEEQLEFFCQVDQRKRGYQDQVDYLNSLHVDQVPVEIDGEMYVRLLCTAGGVAIAIGDKGKYRVVVPGGYFFLKELTNRGKLSNGHYRYLVFLDFAQLVRESEDHADI